MLHLRIRPFFRTSIAPWLALALLATGCADEGGVTGPRPPAEGIRRSSAPDQSAFSWSENLVGPSTNYLDGGAIPWTNVPLAGNRWYRARVTGQTSLIDNPEWVNVCTTAGVDPCPARTYVGSYGPEGVPGSGEMRVLLRTSNGYEIRWDAPGEGFVFFLPAGETVRRMQTGLVSGITCLSTSGCNGRTGRWSGEYGFYAYTSRPRVEIEGAPIPVRVTADRTWDGSGEVVTYTAEADVPRVHDGAVSWFFVPGDTAATPIFPSNEPVPVNACSGKTVCSFARGRYGPGRMYVNWITRYGNAKNASPVIGLRTPPKLVLTCTSRSGANRVPRGQQINCTASTDPPESGELKVTGWQFSGGDFKYPDSEAGDEVPTGTTWGGEMAMSGTVTVKAKLNGVDVSASVDVTVEARTEFKKQRVSVDIRPGTLADVPGRDRPFDPPQSVTDFGRALTNASTLGYEPKTNMAEVLRTIRTIQDEGPNHGLAYLKEVPIQATAIVVIHPALARGSAFFRAQPQTSNIVHGTPPCVQSRWDVYVRQVEEHEGLRGNPNSHVGFFEAALNPAAAEAVEHVVGRVSQLAAMAQEWQELLGPVAARAQKQGSNEVFHSAPGGRVGFGCEFNFDLRGR